MPWDAASFHSHNHALSPAQAGHAAHIANAILRRSGDEGMAIATANKLIHRDDGGMVPAQPAPTPGLQPSNATAGPLAQNYMQRFAQMSPEQLQELLPRLGNSPIAQIAQHVLQQKRVTPQQQAPQQAQPAMPQAGMPAQPATQASGGGVRPAPPIFHARIGMMPHKAVGGASTGMSPAVSTYIANNGANAPPGSTQMGTGINASTGVGASSTGIPALDAYLNSTEAGASFAKPPGPGPVPAAPAPAPDAAQQFYDAFSGSGGGSQKRGGNVGHATGGAPADGVPILAAGGEFVISPEHIARLGDGDIKEGHRRMDEWVVRTRRQIVEKMKKLKPPVKS